MTSLGTQGTNTSKPQAAEAPPKAAEQSTSTAEQQEQQLENLSFEELNALFAAQGGGGQAGVDISALMAQQKVNTTLNGLNFLLGKALGGGGLQLGLGGLGGLGGGGLFDAGGFLGGPPPNPLAALFGGLIPGQSANMGMGGIMLPGAENIPGFDAGANPNLSQAVQGTQNNAFQNFTLQLMGSDPVANSLSIMQQIAGDPIYQAFKQANPSDIGTTMSGINSIVSQGHLLGNLDGDLPEDLQKQVKAEEKKIREEDK
ncbi:MAG: hypothetical protein KTR14_10280 [Vampirovibrio sp.]|nr:hypothetical protein [Vampirovibrio sp.]